MSKYVRVMIAVTLLLGIVLLARNQVAWAQPGTEAERPALAQEADAGPSSIAGGTVKPPPNKIKVCKDGVYSVGGVSILKVKNLAPDYCLKAFVQRRSHVSGHIPDGAGRILADVTFLQVFYRNRLVSQLPEKDGQVQICYAIPPRKQAKLYFKSGALWRPLETTVKNDFACAAAQYSGAYALIGK